MNKKTEMKDIIDAFKKLDLSTSPIKEVEEIISRIGQLPVAITDFDSGKIIHRARKIKKGENLTSVEQLSFTPNKHNTTYQRASTPQQTMFYGAVIPEVEGENEISLERIVGACETSNFLRDTNAPDGEEIIVFGKWRVKKKTSLLSIINPEIESNKIAFFQEMTKNYHSFLEKNKDKKEDAELFQSFLSSEFAKSNIRGQYDYLITSKFTETIIKHLDGVIYPSVRADYNGLCVAIKPETANENLELVAVLECSVTKKGNEVKVENLRYTDKIEDGQFELKPINAT